MEEKYRDIWVVSLFDLMVISDYCDDENELLSYLDFHYYITKNSIKFMDELVVFNGFINSNLKARLMRQKKCSMIVGDTDFFDKEYSGENDLPIINHKE